jgi:hypothetical protein
MRIDWYPMVAWMVYLMVGRKPHYFFGHLAVTDGWMVMVNMAGEWMVAI